MKNAIYYFYGININKIYEINDGFYFFYHNYKYYFFKYEIKENLKYLYNISNELYNINIMVHTFILTKENNFVVSIENENYVLLRINSIEKDNMTIDEIIEFNYALTKIENKLPTINLIPWNIVWSKKIDSIETEINNTIDEYPLIKETIDYYVGLGENAITYVKDVLDTTDQVPTKGICHKRIKDNTFTSYIFNPLTFTIDYLLRDLSEYLKEQFWCCKLNINDIEKIIEFNKFQEIDIKLFYARMLYPSYYFDVVENILNGKKEETSLKSIINKSEKYETFLFDLYILLKRKYNIICIDWILNNEKKINL